MKTKIYLFALLGIVVISSCKKLESLSPGTKTVASHTGSDTDVYVSGYIGASTGALQIPAYWKNGVLHTFRDSANNASAKSFAVHDTDVLIAATIEYSDNSAYTAVYYRWGYKYTLADHAFVGMSHCAIFADCGCDTYICGAMQVNGIYKAVYWKNGVAHMLPEKSPQSFALGITVHGGDVYVAGSAITTKNTKYAVYWKNDTAYALADTLSDSEARDIGVIGNDVYAAGYSSPTFGTNAATVWKSGVPTYLDGSSLLSISTKNGDVNVSGNNSTVGGGRYWVNGTVHPLPATPTYVPTADGITARGSDVYVAGWTTLTPAYWKNGNIVQLPSPRGGVGLSIATAVH